MGCKSFQYFGGKGAARDRLVANNLPNVYSQYKWLDDRSRYSRYTTYKISENEAAKAVQFTNLIKTACVV